MAQGNTIDITGMYPETYDAPGELIHDHVPSRHPFQGTWRLSSVDGGVSIDPSWQRRAGAAAIRGKTIQTIVVGVKTSNSPGIRANPKFNTASPDAEARKDLLPHSISAVLDAALKGLVRVSPL